MAQKSQGIQQLLQAEKKAAELVGEARKKKTKRLKQAKEEAIAEIETFRGECEGRFKEKQLHETGRDDFQKKIVDDTNLRLSEMSNQIKQNEEKVIDRILKLVYEIEPELHENYRKQWANALTQIFEWSYFVDLNLDDNLCTDLGNL